MARGPADWSDPALRLWGKSDCESGAWMPLVQHLEDAAEVAGWLWDEWLPRSIRESIAAPLDGGEADGRTLVTWLAGLHDLGKASPPFQTKIGWRGDFSSVLDGLAEGDLRTPHTMRGSDLPPHGLIGEYLLSRWLTGAFGCRRSVAGTWVSAVGAHHGAAPTFSARQLVQDTAGDSTDRRAVTPTESWAQVQREVIDGMSRRTGALERLPVWTQRRLPVPVQVLVTGVVVVADWLASDPDRFGYMRGDADERAATAGLRDDLPRPWQPRFQGPDALWRSRFPQMEGPMRPIQQALLREAARCAEAPLIVVEAGTGEGKTEAALLAAEVLAERFGQGGVLFALPTQATTDGIFPRLLSWVEELDLDGPASVFLAHGKASLNDQFSELTSHRRVRSIHDDSGEEDVVIEAVVTSWLRGRRRGILASFVASTIDQVLFGALKARHLPLRHLALAGKVVVIDEAHAADDFMRVYLERFLEWLGAYRTPVVLLSATLPPHVRASLIAAYRRGTPGGQGVFAAGAAMAEQHAYPRLTVATSQGIDVVGANGSGQPERGVQVELVGDAWADEVVAAVEAGACVAVIQNTVARAQLAAHLLRERLGPERVTLVHSQFVAVHRATTERELRAMLGPPSSGSPTRRPAGHVVCGTQVLEQSLDIDVDLMVTDIAPVDLVLQRAGRLHRHLRPAGARPDRCTSPRLLISGAFLTAAAPDLDKGSTAVYGHYRLLRAIEALSPCLHGEPLTLPAMTPDLVARAYDESIAGPAPWSQTWHDARGAHDDKVTGQRVAAAAFTLPPVEEHSDLTYFSRGSASDPDGADAARARVRDSEDSLEVIVVRQGPGGVHPLEGIAGLDPDIVLSQDLEPPPPHVARQLLRCSLRLPYRFSQKGRIDATIRSLEVASRQFVSWQRSRWLEGELVLVLDAELRGTIADVPVRYSRHDGLLVGRKEGMDDD